MWLIVLAFLAAFAKWTYDERKRVLVRRAARAAADIKAENDAKRKRKQEERNA